MRLQCNRAMATEASTYSVVHFEGELTSVKVTADSRYAIINHTPDVSYRLHMYATNTNDCSQEIILWDLSTHRIARKYAGQKQKNIVIRSCFGGVEQNFIASGSEGMNNACSTIICILMRICPDGHVYVWHRDTGMLLEALPGHGAGSVNAVTWNPRYPGMFASCSDDNTIRIWEALPAGASTEESDLVAEDRQPGKGKGRGAWDAVGPSRSASSLLSLGTSL